MCRMTCRPRLRQRLRRGENGFIFVAAICLALMVTSARGGSLNAPEAPTNSLSAMWTLENIYNVLDTRTTNVAKRAGAFTEPTGGPANGTMHTLNDIMMLATNRAPVRKTGQTKSWAAYDDGWYGTNLGVAWPTQRFMVVGASGTAETNQIRDNLTGLIWARNANLPGGTMDWTNAVQYCSTNLNAGAGYGGTNDWRLPNVHELRSLISYQFSSPAISDGTGRNKWTEALGPFTAVVGDNYWTSTTFTDSAYRAWLIDSGSAYVSQDSKVNLHRMWPVRGGGQ